jgi:very-short-patch-repair endonuclease
MRYVPRGILSIIGTRASKPLPGVVVHRPRRVFEGQTEVIRGLVVTDRATTLIDLAAVISPGQFERVLDDQLSSRLVKLIAVVHAFNQQARRGRAGIAVARRLIEDRLDGLVASESELEHLFRELIEPRLSVTPIYQFQPMWRTEAIGRTDAGFPDQQVIVELDGRRWHLRDADFDNDRRRDQEALEHKWRTVRYTHHQLTKETARVIRNLNMILEPGP